MTKFNHTPFNRREFLRTAAALTRAGALSAFLNACSRAGLDISATGIPTSSADKAFQTDTPQPEPAAAHTQIENESPTPASTQESAQEITSSMAKIAFVKTTNRAEGVRKAVELLGINPVSGESVFLKPNYNSAHPAPGSTHPDVLRSLVTLLQEMGAKSITVGDRSGMGDTRRVMDELGVFEMAQELGFEPLVFDELQSKQWSKHQPEGSHWKEGFLFAQPCLDCSMIVQACCLKTHKYGGVFTMSLKNSVGMVAKRDRLTGYDYMNELHYSPDQRRMIAEINTVYSPGLVVMDGVEAFRSGGPHEGERVQAELVLAGTDRIALDAVGVAVLQYFGSLKDKPIFEREQIARAVELGLGVNGPDQIELVTGDNASQQYAQEIRAILSAG